MSLNLCDNPEARMTYADWKQRYCWHLCRAVTAVKPEFVHEFIADMEDELRESWARGDDPVDAADNYPWDE